MRRFAVLLAATVVLTFAVAAPASASTFTPPPGVEVTCTDTAAGARVSLTYPSFTIVIKGKTFTVAGRTITFTFPRAQCPA